MVSDRVPSGTHFAELFLAPGPQAIGATGDNGYEALYGRSWLLVWDRDDGYLHLFQEQPGGDWLEVVADLPPVFAGPAPTGSRRWSLAFDQSARVILAYEDATGIVRVTRWDPGSNAYVQNVSFAGADPCLAIDASWSRNVSDSDVLLFYLDPTRHQVTCRVQREIYATEHALHTYEQAVIFDRVIASPLRYQLLLSDATGSVLETVLLSELYPYFIAATVPAGALLEDAVYSADTYYEQAELVLVADALLEDANYVGSTAIIAVPGNIVTAAAELEDAQYVGSTLIHTVDTPEVLGGAARLEDATYVFNTAIVAGTYSLIGGAHVEDAIYKRV
jgi:hypothetical protein